MHLEKNLKSNTILEKAFFGVVAPKLWQHCPFKHSEWGLVWIQNGIWQKYRYHLIRIHNTAEPPLFLLRIGSG
jgi:hypothetical protein